MNLGCFQIDPGDSSIALVLTLHVEQIEPPAFEKCKVHYFFYDVEEIGCI